MDCNSSHGTTGAPPTDMEDISQNIQFLPEKTLQVIAKGPLVQLTLNSTDTEQITRVWLSLLQTLCTPSLSHLHSLAVCNATSAFLDAAVNAQNEGTRELALQPESWLDVFDVFLSRYEDAKPKPLKQILASLITILAKHHKEPTKKILQKAIADATFPSVLLGEPRSRLKASLVCLELVLRKGAILSSELINLVQNWMIENRTRWVPVFEKDCQGLLMNGSQATLDLISVDPSEELAANIFFLGLLNQTNNREMCGSAGGMLAAFVKKLKSECPSRNLSAIWVAPVRHMVLQNMNHLESLANQVLQPLFTIDPTGFKSFVQSLPLESLLAGDMSSAAESEFILLFSALQMGKKINLVVDDFDFSKPSESKGTTLPKMVLKSDIIGRFLFHSVPGIRIAALSLLINALSTVKPFTTSAAIAILRGLPSMHAESDAHSRGEIMSLTRKFIVRMKGGVVRDQDVLDVSNAAQGQPSAIVSRNDTETRNTLETYLQFLRSDLCVTASYARHISALKALKLLIISGLDPRSDVFSNKADIDTTWKLHVEIFDARLLRLLVDLLLDPFEEVRQTSLSIINLFPQQILLGSLIDRQPAVAMRLTDALTRAENVASNTSRADHADTVARLYHILFCAASFGNSSVAASDCWSTKASVVNTIVTRLEERLSSSKGLFNSSMREAPLHGYMSGLRYIVLMPNFHTLLPVNGNSSSWRSIHDRIIGICDRVWEEVKPVLCIDSPEGHTDEPIQDLSVGPKDILSYSWRALRESSLLLHATIINATYGPEGADGLNRADFEKVGRTSFTQLAELRHRGAFSTVATTFTVTCQRCSQSKDAPIQELPEIWYKEAKKTIFESASKLTRRSAGLPALITGILCAAPGSPFFKQALTELHDISRLPVEYSKEEQYLKLPQVHAMNCLKDIFTNNKLGPHTERFIMPALTLSAERLGSPIWALRNSGLMLFRALLTRMCRLVYGAGAGFGGESGSEPGSKISFPKYPGLLELLSSLLTTSEDATAEGTDIVTERIFPALELIGEKIPTVADNNDTMLCELVSEHFKSPVWGIREHAARVYASLLTRTNILHDMRALMGQLQDKISENYLHANVLCARYSLRRFAMTTDSFWTSYLDEILSTLECILATVFPIAKSPFVATALVEILNDTLERSMEAGVEARVGPLVEQIAAKQDLDGISDYVFDASQRNWNLTSTTRSSSLLRRSLMWCKVLTILSSGQWDLLPTYFGGVATFDPDAATWICEQLEERFDMTEKYMKPLADLYSSALLRSYEPSIRIAAASNLASILEKQLSSTGDLAHFALPYEDLAKSFKPHAAIETWNRQATDAELRLQGCLLAIRASIEKQTLAPLSRDFQTWTVKLRSALSEETEFTTRYAAALSLHSFSQGLRPLGSPPRVDSALLDIYLVLYDLLNDDDDEVRDSAASTASWVLSYSSVSPGTAVMLGPLNASSLLASFVTEHYSHSAQFARRVIRYLTGQESRISGSDDQTHLIPVVDLVAEYRQESTVLFVEEKQNLFIDEVREIDVWAPALTHLTKNACPETLVRQVSSWVSEGLQYLLSLVSQDAGQDGLLGWLSKPESFTLGVRIFSISAALTSPGFAVPELLEADQQVMRSRLHSLLNAGQSASVHDQWLLRIRTALNLEV